VTKKRLCEQCKVELEEDEEDACNSCKDEINAEICQTSGQEWRLK
jgi:hypothetical protein